MKKNYWRRSVFIVFIFVLSFIFTSNVFSATKIYLPKAKLLTDAKSLITDSNINSILGLSQNENLKLLNSRKDKNSIEHLRYRQLYKGIPVWGYHIIIAKTKNGMFKSLHGTKWSGIGDDLNNVVSSIATFNESDALTSMKKYHSNQNLNKNLFFENETSEKVIYFDNDEKAKVCFAVSFYADTVEGGNPSRWTFIVDALTKEIIFKFNALAHASGTGPGGNLKTGKYIYGSDYDPFIVNSVGSSCIMESTNVKTVDLNHGTSGSNAYSYTCYENNHKEINGAYCPLNDAQFFGQVVFDMYSDWYSTAPLTFQLVMRVHYSNEYENAFWNGSSMTFGDGKDTFYPLVCLDVTSHEVSHGFTEQNSNLTYSGQSGGINEAFSDIAGESAEFFLRGANDWMVGEEIFKGTGALRYMDDPTKDGNSIGSADDYYSGMNVHYSSGVFNKAFYLLSTTSGWNVKKAFDCFVKANQDYWGPSTNFQQGAEGVRDAASDLGYSQTDVKNAFAAVDINITVTEGISSDFSFITSDLTATFTDLSVSSGSAITSWDWSFGDTNSSTIQNPVHTFSTQGTYNVTLTVTNSAGQSNSISKTVEVPQVADYCESKGTNQNYEWIKNVQVGTMTKASEASNYSDFTSIVANITKGAETSVSITPGFAGWSYAERVSIFIDLNKDGDFLDTGETVFQEYGSSTISGSIIIPSSAITGNTRMRISLKYGSYSTPCEEFNYGEVEDYTVNISN
ncbi:MAG: PKD domain-containing protein [Deltaproteobacteria bacterium]|nr:PKD domain-containing protein [Deltaproteobacteria bacterium]